MKVMIGLNAHQCRVLLSAYANMDSRIPLPCRVLCVNQERERLEAIMCGVGARDH